MTENAFIPLFAVTAYVLFLTISKPSVPNLIFLVLLAAILPTVHQWGILSVPVIVGVLIWLAFRHRISVAYVGTASIVIIAAIAGLGMVHNYVILNLFPGAHTDVVSPTGVVSSVLAAHKIVDVFWRLVGEFWVASASSLGLYPLGLIVCALLATRKVTFVAGSPALAEFATVILISELILLSASALGMASVAITFGDSPNLVFVSRYIDGEIGLPILFATAAFVSGAIGGRIRQGSLLASIIISAISSSAILLYDAGSYFYGAEGEFVNSIAYVSLLRLFGSPSEGVLTAGLIATIAAVSALLWTKKTAVIALVLVGTVFGIASIHEGLGEYLIKQRWLTSYIGSPTGALVPLLRMLPTTENISVDSASRGYFTELYPLAVPAEQFSWFGGPPDSSTNFVLASNLWPGGKFKFSEISCETFEDICLWGRPSPLTSALLQAAAVASSAPPSRVEGTEIGSERTPFTRSEGIYYEEFHGPDRWRWADGDAKIYVSSAAGNLPPIIHFNLSSPTPGPFDVLFDGRRIFSGNLVNSVVENLKVPKSSSAADSEVEIRFKSNPGAAAYTTTTREFMIHSISFLDAAPPDLIDDRAAIRGGVLSQELAGSIPFHWTTGDAIFEIVNAKRARKIQLFLVCPDQTTQSNLEVLVNGRAVVKASIHPGGWQQTIDIGTSPLKSLEIRSSTFTLPGVPHPYGVQIRQLRLEP